MSKRKRSSRSTHQAQGRVPPPDQQQVGLRAFHSGRFDAAIAAWSPLAHNQPRVAAALAEAYFRRALTRPRVADQIADLRQAVALAADEPRYQYHLGLALHRMGDLPAAMQCYRTVLQRDNGWPGAGMALALAVLDQDPRADIAALPGSSGAVRVALAPVQALLRGGLPVATGDGPFDRLWHGLGLINARDRMAVEVLDDSRPLPAPAASVRRYYQGVAAAQSEDLARASEAWQGVASDGFDRPWLRDNLSTVLLHRLGAQLAANDLEQAAETALGGLPLAAGSAALGETLVQVLDRAAHAAAAAGNWERAGSLWEAAREVVGANSGLGSPRPLLHNVALAYEAQERWSEAAEAWRAMLRTRPRKAAARSQGSEGGDQAVEANPQGLSDAQWAWVRARVIECYKRAGTPGEAVALFRQALKAAPDDIETRLQLVDALFGNEQEQAALNELGRILQIDPHHVDAQIRLANLRSERGEWQAAEQVLRNVLAQHPEREDVRRQMARLLLSHGMELHQWGNRAGAARLFEEGRRFAPDDYQFPLNLGRIAIDERKPNKARPLLERALELAPDQPAAYISVIDCWAVADKIDEARAVLSRAEGVFPPSPEFYVQLATMLLNRSAPPPMLLPFAPAPPSVPANGAWSQLATEMLDKAVALRPGDPQLRRQIGATLMLRQPDLALRYAEEAAQLAPDDPEMLLVLGLALGLNERTREAKETLRRTARIARQQGRPEIAEEAEDLRRQVGSPFLRASLQMAQMANEIGLDLDDLYL